MHMCLLMFVPLWFSSYVRRRHTRLFLEIFVAFFFVSSLFLSLFLYISHAAALAAASPNGDSLESFRCDVAAAYSLLGVAAAALAALLPLCVDLNTFAFFDIEAVPDGQLEHALESTERSRMKLSSPRPRAAKPSPHRPRAYSATSMSSEPFQDSKQTRYYLSSITLSSKTSATHRPHAEPESSSTPRGLGAKEEGTTSQSVSTGSPNSSVISGNFPTFTQPSGELFRTSVSEEKRAPAARPRCCSRISSAARLGRKYKDALSEPVLRKLYFSQLILAGAFVVSAGLEYALVRLGRYDGLFVPFLLNTVLELFAFIVYASAPCEKVPSSVLSNPTTSEISKVFRKSFYRHPNYLPLLHMIVFYQFLLSGMVYGPDVEKLALLKDMLRGVKGRLAYMSDGAGTRGAKGATPPTPPPPFIPSAAQCPPCEACSDRPAERSPRPPGVAAGSAPKEPFYEHQVTSLHTVHELSDESCKPPRSNSFEETPVRQDDLAEFLNPNFLFLNKKEFSKLSASVKAWSQYWTGVVDTYMARCGAGECVEFCNPLELAKMIRNDALFEIFQTTTRRFIRELRFARFKHPSVVSGSELPPFTFLQAALSSMRNPPALGFKPTAVRLLHARLMKALGCQSYRSRRSFSSSHKFDEGDISIVMSDLHDPIIEDIQLLLEYRKVPYSDEVFSHLFQNNRLFLLEYSLQRKDIPPLVQSRLDSLFNYTIISSDQKKESSGSTDHEKDEFGPSFDTGHGLSPDERKIKEFLKNKRTLKKHDAASERDVFSFIDSSMVDSFSSDFPDQAKSSSSFGFRAWLPRAKPEPEACADEGSSLSPSSESRAERRPAQAHAQGPEPGSKLGPEHKIVPELHLKLIPSSTDQAANPPNSKERLIPSRAAPPSPIRSAKSDQSNMFGSSWHISQNYQIFLPFCSSSKKGRPQLLVTDRLSCSSSKERLEVSRSAPNSARSSLRVETNPANPREKLQETRILLKRRSSVLASAGLGDGPVHASDWSNTSSSQHSKSVVPPEVDDSATPKASVFFNDYVPFSFVAEFKHPLSPYIPDKRTLFKAYRDTGFKFTSSCSSIDDDTSVTGGFDSRVNYHNSTSFAPIQKTSTFSSSSLEIKETDSERARASKSDSASVERWPSTPTGVLSTSPSQQIPFRSSRQYLGTNLFSWRFNSAFLTEISNNHPLLSIGLAIHSEEPTLFPSILKPFSLKRFSMFLMAVEKKYRTNPYHNATHAADVAQFAYNLIHGLRKAPVVNEACYYTPTGAAHGAQSAGPRQDNAPSEFSFMGYKKPSSRKKLTMHATSAAAAAKAEGAVDAMKAPRENLTHPFDVWLPEHIRAAMILAIILHDVDHPGYNNAFLQECQHPLANMYNNSSIIEAHSASLGMFLLKECGFETPKPLVECIRTLILSTDMSYHTHIISLARMVCNRLKKDTKLCSSVISAVHEERHWQTFSVFSDLPKRGANPTKALGKKARTLFLSLVIKLCDICNQLRPFDLAERWSLLMSEEFFNHGDHFKTMGIPIDRFSDRNEASDEALAESQSRFISFVVLPLHNQFQQFVSCIFGIPDTYFAVQWSLSANLQRWKDIASRSSR